MPYRQLHTQQLRWLEMRRIQSVTSALRRLERSTHAGRNSGNEMGWKKSLHVKDRLEPNWKGNECHRSMFIDPSKTIARERNASLRKLINNFCHEISRAISLSAVFYSLSASGNSCKSWSLRKVTWREKDRRESSIIACEKQRFFCNFFV